MLILKVAFIVVVVVVLKILMASFRMVCYSSCGGSYNSGGMSPGHCRCCGVGESSRHSRSIAHV